MKSIKELLKQQQKELFDGSRFVTQEFQDFGYRIAVKLDDLKHKALYIKLARNEPRALVEQALSFAVDYPNAKNRARLFMWKLNDLKKGSPQNGPDGSATDRYAENGPKESTSDLKSSDGHAEDQSHHTTGNATQR
ncbi:MAG: hypothetical protein PHG63_01370 [Candidatus Dojkabacteria bacterium]|nr:hypothetical protein [Candidatus Dojkabacteria bacterium]